MKYVGSGCNVHVRASPSTSSVTMPSTRVPCGRFQYPIKRGATNGKKNAQINIKIFKANAVFVKSQDALHTKLPNGKHTEAGRREEKTMNDETRAVLCLFYVCDCVRDTRTKNLH